jgi:anthraniloyl-CoA monooxygenase
MRIVCVGGGPAGLYFAISLKRRDPAHEITVVERDRPRETYGWGVVYWDDLLDMMCSNDMESGRRIRRASRLWREQEVRVQGRSAFLPGYGYSIQRAALLDILAARARELDVEVRHSTALDPATDAGAELAGADLLVAADGAHSGLRARYEEQLGTRIVLGANRYIWLGSGRVFEKFTFSFRHTPEGWLWFHAYPSGHDVSTCIVECTDKTWRAHGLDWRDDADGAALLAKIFDADLAGAPLISRSRDEPARWLRFVEVSNDTWVHHNLALLGDAAHTTHFSIGSGTRLAMIDAVTLAQSIYENPDPPAALRHYDQRRRPELGPIQASARGSQAWFEHAERYLGQSPSGFAYSMSSRQGEQPPWRYQQHRAVQIPLLRAGLRHLDTVGRRYGALRRGEAREG